MNNANAIEVSMPVVQPADLWQESGRWEQYGPELLRFVDRGDRPFVLGPTHEEVITDLIRNEISSYKQLPLNFFQIQTKFRDEVRPRFGVMRSREFLMKDSYSFYLTGVSAGDLRRDVRSVQQNLQPHGPGFPPGAGRYRLDRRQRLARIPVLADSGEDDIVFSTGSDFAANIELAEAVAPAEPRAAASEALRRGYAERQNHR